MKKFTKITSLLAAAALLAFLPDSNVLTASAEEPATYAIGYVDEEEEWGYQEGSDFDPAEKYDELDELEGDIKDGDILVIYGNSEKEQTIRIPAYLSNLTIMGGDKALIVYTEGIEEAHIAYGALAAINGAIKKAYVYDDSMVTFNDPVSYLEIRSSEYAVVTTSSTVEHAICYHDEDVEFNIYNVAAGALLVEDSELETEEGLYSTTPAPAQSSSQSGTSSSLDEYDDVPKTGESFSVYLLLAAAAVCFTGSRVLKKA